MARTPKAKPAASPPAASGINFYVSPTYAELPAGEDGVMRVEAGSYVVTGDDGNVAVMNPAAFAAQYPEHAG